MAYIIWFAVNANEISEKKAKWCEIPDVICLTGNFHCLYKGATYIYSHTRILFINNDNDLKAWISVLVAGEEYPKLHNSCGLWCLVSNSSRPNTPAWHHYSGFRGVWSRAQAEASPPLKTQCSWLIALFPVFVWWRKSATLTAERGQWRAGC